MHNKGSLYAKYYLGGKLNNTTKQARAKILACTKNIHKINKESRIAQMLKIHYFDLLLIVISMFVLHFHVRQFHVLLLSPLFSRPHILHFMRPQYVGKICKN